MAGEGYADPHDRSVGFGVFWRDWDPAVHGRDAGTQEAQHQFLVFRRRRTGRKTDRLTGRAPLEFADPAAVGCASQVSFRLMPSVLGRLP